LPVEGGRPLGSRELIIGIHSGLNASAAIGTSDGQLLYAVQEERLSRDKNHIGFPSAAIARCLDWTAARPDDIAGVAHGSLAVWLPRLSRAEFLALLERSQDRQTWRARTGRAIRRVRRGRPDQDALLRQGLAGCGLAERPISRYDHHTTHAATAYYGLRADAGPYLVLTCDGQGDGASATVATYRNGRRREWARTSETDSLGLPYLWTTFDYGFVPHEDEYKLMGMAPFASSERAAAVAEAYRALIRLDPADPLRFQEISGRGFLSAWQEFRPRLERMRFDHVFAGLQRFTEDTLCAWVQAAVARTGVRRVLAAGGVFMNVKANQRLAALPEVESFGAFPSCGDESLAIGAYYLAAEAAGARVAPLTDYFLGDPVDAEPPPPPDGCVVTAHDDTTEATAGLLSRGEIIARCVGRMEFGARALGNRSILAPAGDPRLVNRLNQLVKRREFWMPFAPAILAERSEEYLDANAPHSPYMMSTFATRRDRRDSLAAVVHPADHSARAQIVHERENPALYGLLKAYERRTGEAVLLNTSFNLHGEPIVRTAADALRVFELTDLPHLIFERCIVSKQGCRSGRPR